MNGSTILYLKQMKKTEFQSPDKLIIVSYILALIALLFLGFFTLRENRISSGITVNLVHINLTAGIILSLLFSLCVLVSVLKKIPFRHYIIALIANGILFYLLWLLGYESGPILEQHPSEYARISPNIGFWILIFSIYVILYTLKNKNIPPLFVHRLIKAVLLYSGMLFFIILLISGFFDDLSILKEFQNKQDKFLAETWHHLFLATISVSFGVIIGIPLGILAYKIKITGQPVFTLLNFFQTIPSLALFGLLIVPLAFISQKFPVLREWGIKGIGSAPAIIALTMYSLLPIVQNTYTSLKIISPFVIEAGIGMGMNRYQLLGKVQFPLALPIVLTGIRIAVIQAIGNTTVVALIGAGGLGSFIFEGLGQVAFDLILLGAIPVILLSLMVDGLMKLLIGLLTPKGLLKTMSF